LHLQHWLWLFLVQSIWAASYIGMKAAGDEMPVGIVVVLRYGLASAGLLAAAAFTGLPRFSRRDLVWMVFLGAFNFALAPTMQVASLRYTQAADVSILIAFEPILMVVMAALALGERPARQTVFALLIGTIGMLFLSGFGTPGDAADARARLWGNVLFVASLLCEVSVSISGRSLTSRYRPSQIMLAMKFAGFAVASLVYAPLIANTDFAGFSLRAWAAVIFLAIGPSMFAYTMWYHILKTVPANQVGLSLFIQPLVGSILGWWLLSETLGLETLIGAVIVCSSLAWWQLRTAAQLHIEPLEKPG
jgi:drug/metabolite transporter (DMT)-like permease